MDSSLANRKWLDMMESNKKMLVYAKRELAEGNTLNALVMLDSLCVTL